MFELLSQAPFIPTFVAQQSLLLFPCTTKYYNATELSTKCIFTIFKLHLVGLFHIISAEVTPSLECILHRMRVIEGVSGQNRNSCSNQDPLSCTCKHLNGNKTKLKSLKLFCLDVESCHLEVATHIAQTIPLISDICRQQKSQVSQNQYVSTKQQN